jgi:phytoene synthase
VDDVADDETVPVEERRRRLADWRADVERACSGAMPQKAVNRELQPYIVKHRLPLALFEELIRGVEMDLEIKRYQTMQTSSNTVYRVASVVGCSQSRFLVTKTPGAAITRSVLAKLSNSPTSCATCATTRSGAGFTFRSITLQRFGVTESEILSLHYTDRFRQLAEAVAARARHFTNGRVKHCPPEDRRSMAAAELMGSVYWRLLRKLEFQQFDVFGPNPTRLTKMQKDSPDPAHVVSDVSQGQSCQTMALAESTGGALTVVDGALGHAPPRRLIINADDFGLSHEVNMAVVRAHTEGVLTTASLMVNEDGFGEAVETGAAVSPIGRWTPPVPRLWALGAAPK